VYNFCKVGFTAVVRQRNRPALPRSRKGYLWNACRPTSRSRFCRNRPAGRAFVVMAETKTPTEPLILVVDDEELLRLHAADLLEEHGFRVVEARNAAAALKVLESRDDVRLLFTDIQMPGALDGMDLAREVHQRWPNILLVITSGQKKPTEDEIPDHGRFVAKPYRAAELLGQVADMIHKDNAPETGA
jgi:CheY-like chemotaxis protein